MGYTLKDSKVAESKIMTVLKMHAEGFKVADICVTTELAYATVHGLIVEPSNKAFIDDFRRGYMARVMDVPVANKRVRMDDLEVSRKRLLHELSLLADGEISKVSNVIRRLVEVLERAHNEMEQRPIFLAQLVSGYNSFGRMTDEQLYDKRQELILLARRSLATPIDGVATEGVEDGEIKQ
jgi:hypothetical protein